MDEIGSGPPYDPAEPAGPIWGMPTGDPVGHAGQPYGQPYGEPFGDAGQPSGPPPAGVPPVAGSAAVQPAGPTGWARQRMVKVAALVGAGVLALVFGIAALQHNDATAGNSATAAGQGAATAPGGTTGTAPGGAGGFGANGFGGGPGGGFGGGGVAGETRVLGTISAVGSASVSVTAADGSKATYAVTSDTEILLDGSPVALSSLKAGEAVLVHVLPGAGQGTAERVLVGSSAMGRGGPPPGFSGGHLPDGTTPDQTTPDQTTPDQTTPDQTGGTTTTTTET